MAKRKRKTKTDVDQVKQAASGRWSDILADVAGLPRDALDGRHGPCPKCDGTDRFRALDDFAETGAVYCNQCFSTANGDGISATQWALGIDFKAALAKVAEYLGVEGDGVPKPKADPSEHLTWRPWNDALVALWCLKKPPITPAALKAAGARMARYRKNYTVLALPIWGKGKPSREIESPSASPVGWVLMNISGGFLMRRTATGEYEKVHKPKVAYGSEPGILGDVERLQNAVTAWKVEGVTDMLAMLSCPDLPPDHAVATNNFGAKQRPTKWMCDLIAGQAKTVLVLHDLDLPGQDGALGWDDNRGRRREGWCEGLARSVQEVRNVVLPGPITEDHGQDLRDYLQAGGSFEQLRELAGQAEAVEVAARAVNRDVDDPFRMAALNLERYAAKTGGRTLKFWNGGWWQWKGCYYRPVGDEEVRSKIWMAVNEEFERLNQVESDEFEIRKEAGQLNEGEKPPFVRKITPTYIGAVVGNTKAQTCISGQAELNTWLPTKEERSYISLANGILDVEKVMANAEDGYLLPHTPDWFSPSHFAYKFDPAAKCPIWLDFLDFNLAGQTDMIAFLQEWVGYLLLPDTGEQRFLILTGEGGNGKSVFCAGLEAIVGVPNCSYVPLETFGDRFSKTQTLGKLINICGDVGEIDAVAEGAIKAFTAGNRMMFDRKGQPATEAKPTARLIIACNTLPRIRDRSEGIWRRVLISPWDVRVPKEKRIKNMDKAEWWTQTGEVPGMFIWALQGLARLRKQGDFTQVEAMTEAVEEYKLDLNPAKQWILSHTVRVGGTLLWCDHVYRQYRKWAEAGNYRPLAISTFSKEVRRAYPGMEAVRRGGRGHQKKYYAGLDYLEDAIPMEEMVGAYPNNF